MDSYLRLLNRLASGLGYMTPLPTLISLAPVDMSLSVSGSVHRGAYANGHVTVGDGAIVERDTDLSGDVILKQNALIERGSSVGGDVIVERNAKIGEESKVRGNITVGRYSNLNGDNYVIGDVSLGKFCAIAPRTSFWAKNHEMDNWAMQYGFRNNHDTDLETQEEPIRIGSDVWCGLDAMVLPGVEVGHGACIGAHSVVTRDVDPYEVVAGNPAEHIGWRFDEQKRRTFLEMEWWNWNMEEIKNRIDDLQTVY